MGHFFRKLGLNKSSQEPCRATLCPSRHVLRGATQPSMQPIRVRLDIPQVHPDLLGVIGFQQVATLVPDHKRHQAALTAVWQASVCSAAATPVSGSAAWSHGPVPDRRSTSATPDKVSTSAPISRKPNGSPNVAAAANTPMTGVSRVTTDAVAGGTRRNAANQLR